MIFIYEYICVGIFHGFHIPPVGIFNIAHPSKSVKYLSFLFFLNNKKANNKGLIFLKAVL